MFVHQPVLVVHHVVSRRVHTRQTLLFCLALLDLLLDVLVGVLVGHHLLVMLHRDIVETLCFLHEGQLLSVTVAKMGGRRALLFSQVLDHHLIAHSLLLHLVNVDLCHLSLLLVVHGFAVHLLLARERLIPVYKGLVEKLLVHLHSL